MDKICCFAGHSDIYNKDNIYQKLLPATEELILKEGVNIFRVGNYGDFDALSAKAVRALKDRYPHIKLELIIPYLTSSINEYKEQYYNNYDSIIIADIPEKTPKSLRIIKANQYMVRNSDFLLCFVERSFGGAFKTLEYAQKKRDIKTINLGAKV